MSWKKRVREIAERNPSALHPIIRGARAKTGDKAWDRVEWQTVGDGNVQAEDAARPIRLVLNWLQRHRLLTPQGNAMLSASAESLALTSSLVVPTAAQFLDTHYEHWHGRHGINLIIDHSMSPTAEEALESLWLKERQK